MGNNIISLVPATVPVQTEKQRRAATRRPYNIWAQTAVPNDAHNNVASPSLGGMPLHITGISNGLPHT